MKRRVVTIETETRIPVRRPKDQVMMDLSQRVLIVSLTTDLFLLANPLPLSTPDQGVVRGTPTLGAGTIAVLRTLPLWRARMTRVKTAGSRQKIIVVERFSIKKVGVCGLSVKLRSLSPTPARSILLIICGPFFEGSMDFLFRGLPTSLIEPCVMGWQWCDSRKFSVWQSKGDVTAIQRFLSFFPFSRILRFNYFRRDAIVLKKYIAIFIRRICIVILVASHEACSLLGWRQNNIKEKKVKTLAKNKMNVSLDQNRVHEDNHLVKRESRLQDE